jgi:hypothetical protein
MEGIQSLARMSFIGSERLGPMLTFHPSFLDNWYKRNPVDYYTIPYFALDAAAMALEHPQFASLGGNTGTVNSFVGLDPANLTEGVFNADTLLEGNNALCYGFRVYGQQLPDILTGEFRGQLAQWGIF